MKKIVILISILVIGCLVWVPAFADNGEGVDDLGLSESEAEPAVEPKATPEPKSADYNTLTRDYGDTGDQGLHNIFEQDAERATRQYEKPTWRNFFKWRVP